MPTNRIRRRYDNELAQTTMSRTTSRPGGRGGHYDLSNCGFKVPMIIPVRGLWKAHLTNDVPNSAGRRTVFVSWRHPILGHQSDDVTVPLADKLIEIMQEKYPCYQWSPSYGHYGSEATRHRVGSSIQYTIVV